MTDDQVQKLRELLVRGGVPQERADSLDIGGLCASVDTLSDVFGSSRAPDANWFRDLYLITGEHVVLTEHGWDYADIVGEDEVIIKELNAPEVA